MFSSYFLLPIWLGVILMISMAHCALKQWIPNLNYDNSENWLDNKVPDLGSDLIYPRHLYALTTLPKQVGNLNLPLNGGFLLATNGEIVVRESTNKRSFFRMIHKKPWLLSNNWRLLNYETNRVHDYNAAIPHQEMIPCQTDVVVFAADTAFRVDLQYLPKIQARGISLAGDTLDLEDFQAFLSTEVGQLMFLNTDDTIFESSRCGDAATDECVCQASNVLDILCENERNDCTTPHCFEPVQPIGHCCPICAGVAQIEYLPGQNVSVAKLKERVDKQVRISGYGPKDVDTHVSIVKDSSAKRQWIQLIIVDKQDFRGISTELVAGLRKTLLQQIYRGESKFS
jgi:protein amnionless